MPASVSYTYVRRSRPSGDATDPSHGSDDIPDNVGMKLDTSQLTGMDLTIWLSGVEV